jgi:hypothetical protein
VFLWPIVEIVQARNWRETSCTILSSEVQTHSGSKGSRTYSVAVSYEYFVDDQRYVSTRYKFMGGSSSGYDGKAEIVQRLGPGTKTVCYVNKHNPADAVLERGFPPSFRVHPVIFAVIGAGGLYGTFVYKGSRSRSRRRRGAARGGPRDEEPVGRPEPARLRRRGWDACSSWASSGTA